MALFASPPRALNAFIYRSTDLNATPVVDISSLPGDGTTHYLEQVLVDNSVGGGANVYIKIYDTKAPIVGETDPEVVFLVGATTSSTLLVPDGLPFLAGISACAVTTGGTAGNVNPPTTVSVTFVVRTA